MSKAKIGALAVAGVLAASAAIIKPWEGEVRKGYADIVNVPTACVGHTGPDVRIGEIYSAAQCRAWLNEDMREALDGLAKCVTAPVAEHEAAALISWTFNVGVRAACGSTLVRYLNAGYPPATWCGQLFRWNRAGGREVLGLTRRRAAEYKVCVGKA